MGAVLATALAAAAAFFLALAVVGVLRQGLEQYKARYLQRSIDDLGEMFVFLDARQVLLLNVAALAGSCALGFWAFGALAAAAFAVAGAFLPGAAVRLYKRRRVRRFEAQLADALQQLANAIRAGLTLPQSLEQVARDSSPQLRQELGLVIKELKLGVSVDDALAALSTRVGSEDAELVATSTAIARQLGGNLAAMFETIAATVRERFRLEGRIHALTSQGKLQGRIVAALPPALGLFLDAVRPDLVRPMFESAFGYVLVGAIALLEAIGFLLIGRIVDIDV